MPKLEQVEYHHELIVKLGVLFEFKEGIDDVKESVVEPQIGIVVHRGIHTRIVGVRVLPKLLDYVFNLIELLFSVRPQN